LHTLAELAEAFEIMSDVSYDHHVTKEKNDFAVWVKETLDNKELASKLSSAKERKKALQIVKKQLGKQESSKAPEIASKLFYIGLALGIALGVILTIFYIRIIAAYLYYI